MGAAEVVLESADADEESETCAVLSLEAVVEGGATEPGVVTKAAEAEEDDSSSDEVAVKDTGSPTGSGRGSISTRRQNPDRRSRAQGHSLSNN